MIVWKKWYFKKKGCDLFKLFVLNDLSNFVFKQVINYTCVYMKTNQARISYSYVWINNGKHLSIVLLSLLKKKKSSQNLPYVYYYS